MMRPDKVLQRSNYQATATSIAIPWISRCNFLTDGNKFCFLFWQAQLEMIMATNGLSENVFEIASKSLAA